MNRVQDYFNPALWPDSHLLKSRQRLVTATNELATLFRAQNFPIIAHAALSVCRLYVFAAAICRFKKLAKDLCYPYINHDA